MFPEQVRTAQDTMHHSVGSVWAEESFFCEKQIKNLLHSSVSTDQLKE